jgi:hypothetical protein
LKSRTLLDSTLTPLLFFVLIVTGNPQSSWNKIAMGAISWAVEFFVI